MATIVTRAGKGSPLTNTEVDANFTNLNTDKLEISGGQLTGNITMSGSQTVDGRDLSADGTKLDTIETNADVTDATNVTAAGALMDGELTNIAAVKALNQGLATTDEVAFDNTTLNAIATDISDTAVDVFVYDTSKDSDGGAWRKRTQNTSWYNEAASSTRGSRKEFPAVAVIVVQDSEDGAVVIYDGDDPDMPLWMKFNSGNMLPPNTSPPTSVSALNGDIMLGFGNDGTTRGCGVIKFVSDTAYWWRKNTASFAGNYIGGGIINRNSSGSYDGSQPTRIVDNNVNDVAMTVLPNAPIDAATGLPVPTIAVATDGGVSVIRDDGAVVDITNSNSSFTVADKATLNSSGRLSFINSYSLGGNGWIYVFNSLPSADNVITINTKTGSTQNADALYDARGLSAVDDDLVLIGGQDDINAITESSVGVTAGLTLLDENTTTASKGMVAYTTSTYNTGWMNGDIKLATLSDTDATNVTGSELVTNGDFAGNLNNWDNNSSGTGSVVYDSGTGAAKFTRVDGNNNGVLAQGMSLVSGQKYVLSFDVATGTTTNVQIRGYISSTSTTGSVIESSFAVSAGNSYGVTFVAPSGEDGLEFRGITGTNTVLYLDNISVRLAEEDRSVNGNGLQVFGTVTKTAVATGADLVSYRSSGSSYLRQPQAGGLVLTNDFSMTWWQKYDGSGGTYEGWQIVEDDVTGSTNYAKVVISAMHQISNMSYLVRGANLGGFDTASNTISSNVWHCLCLTKVGSSIKLYIDGSLKASSTGTIVTPSNPYSLELLRWSYGTTRYLCANSELSLFRTSNTAPSPEQIAKIYNDEKHLFQTGAQATLYGSSDAVTALAHDDTTELLHVGTSAGRSVFQGLRRVDNTTDAVGAAISASNGLVAED